MKKNFISNLITIDKVRGWKEGIITISAPTGVGKSFFIKNVLYKVAKEQEQKILFLVHRQRVKEQFYNELKEDKKLDVISIKTYQTIENNKDFHFLNGFKYIVCDEFHYFTSDSNFNYKTDISLEKILRQTNKVLIFMSATGILMKNYLRHRNLKTRDYKIKTNFDWINSLNFFNKDKTIEGIIDNVIKSNEKALVFIESSEKAYKLYKKYKKNSIFCCSKSNDRYKHVNEESIELMLRNQKFEKNFLITTTCLDAGINLIDDDIKTIICDISDIGVLIQCLGRKRRKEQEKVNIYIKNINNNVLGGRLTKLKLARNMIKDFNIMSIEEFTEKYSKAKNDFYNTLFYDEGSIKKLNELMAFKIIEQFLLIKRMIGYKGKKGYGYKNYLANNIFKMKYKTLEIYDKNIKLEEYLNNITGKQLLKKEQKELISTIGLRDSRGRIKTSVGLIRNYLILNFNKIIITNRPRINGKQQTVWRVIDLI